MMTTVERPVRRLEWTTATTVRALNAKGKLPVPYGPPKPDQRFPTDAEWYALRWLLAWERERVVGVGACRLMYDYHSGRDILEIVTVRGTRRGAIDVTRRLIAYAHELGRPAAGMVESNNARMRAFLGLVATEGCVRFEAAV